VAPLTKRQLGSPSLKIKKRLAWVYLLHNSSSNVMQNRMHKPYGFIWGCVRTSMCPPFSVREEGSIRWYRNRRPTSVNERLRLAMQIKSESQSAKRVLINNLFTKQVVKELKAASQGRIFHWGITAGNVMWHRPCWSIAAGCRSFVFAVIDFFDA